MSLKCRLCLTVLISGVVRAENWNRFPGTLNSGNGSEFRDDINRQGLSINPQPQFPGQDPQGGIARTPMAYDSFQPYLPPANGLGPPSFGDDGRYGLDMYPPPPPGEFLEPPYGPGTNSKDGYLVPLLVGAGIKTAIVSVAAPLAVLGIVGKLIGKGVLGVGGATLLGGSSPLAGLASSLGLGSGSPLLGGISPSQLSSFASGRRRRQAEGLTVQPLTSERLRTIETARRYLTQLGYREENLLDDLSLTFMTCAGFLDRNNHCLERLACEFSSVRPDTPSVEKEVAAMIINNVLNNKRVDRIFKDNIRRASNLGQKQNVCFFFHCNQMHDHTQRRHQYYF